MKIKNKNGFSLVELIVALAIASVILVTATRFLSSALNQYGKDNYEIKLQTETAEILNLLENWIMDAETVSVTTDETSGNDILNLTKKDSAGNKIVSKVYVRDANIYYDKVVSGSIKEVYLGTHVHINSASEGNKKNLSFKISENKKMVYVDLNMSFGSANYNASRKILLRNWREEEEAEAEEDETTTDSSGPIKKAEISVNEKGIVEPQNSQHSKFELPIAIKNTDKDLSLATANGGNGLEFVVYFYFRASGGLIDQLNIQNNWSANGGQVTGVLVQVYPGSANKNKDLYYAKVNIKSTANLEKNNGIAGWSLNKLLDTSLSWQPNSSYSGDYDFHMNGYSSNGNPNLNEKVYIEAYYLGNLIASYGDKNGMPTGEAPSDNTYTVTYNANGGSNAPEAQTKTKGVDLKLSNVTLTRDGYTFRGWATSTSATEAEYSIGGSYTKDEDVTLYAVWFYNAIDVTVKYDANGGQNAPGDQTGKSDAAITVSGQAPTREGYSFVGWATTNYANSAEYYGNNSYLFKTSVVTLYAVWSQNQAKQTYTINFNANYGDLNGYPGSKTKEEGKTLSLADDNEPTREGFTFIGWAKDSNATSAEYAPDGEFTEDVWITLYAVWRDERSPILKITNTWMDNKSPWVVISNEGGAADWNKIEIRYYYLYEGEKQNISSASSDSTDSISDNYICEFQTDKKYQFGYYKLTNSSNGTISGKDKNGNNGSTNKLIAISSDNNITYNTGSDIISSINWTDAVCLYYDGVLVSGKEPSIRSLMMTITDHSISYNNGLAEISFVVNKSGLDIDWSNLTLKYYLQEDEENPYSISNVYVESINGGPVSITNSVVHASDKELKKEKANSFITFGFIGQSSVDSINEKFKISFTVSGNSELLTEEKSFSCESTGRNIYGIWSGEQNLGNGNSNNLKTFGKYPTRDIIEGSDTKTINNPQHSCWYSLDREVEKIIIEFGEPSDQNINLQMEFRYDQNGSSKYIKVNNTNVNNTIIEIGERDYKYFKYDYYSGRDIESITFVYYPIGTESSIKYTNVANDQILTTTRPVTRIEIEWSGQNGNANLQYHYGRDNTGNYGGQYSGNKGTNKTVIENNFNDYVHMFKFSATHGSITSVEFFYD